MKKRIVIGLILCGLIGGLIALPASAAEIIAPPDAKNGIYCVDAADCLSSVTKAYIDSRTAALTRACGGQVAVVTLEQLNGMNCQEYAYEVINQWGVGDKDRNNGVVFVLVPSEKKCWLTVGSGLEKDLTDEMLETLLENNCYAALDSGNYDTAVRQTVEQVFAWFESHYQIDINSGAIFGQPANSWETWEASAGPGFVAPAASIVVRLGLIENLWLRTR